MLSISRLEFVDTARLRVTPPSIIFPPDLYRVWYNIPLAPGAEPDDGRVLLGGSGEEGKCVPAIFFRTEAGTEPVRDWPKSLPLPEDRMRIGEDIKTVEFGWL